MTSLLHSQDKSMIEAICCTALDAVVAVNHEGTVVAFNERAEELFGYSVTYAIGRPMVELIVPERYRDAHTAGMKRYIDTGVRTLIGGKVEIDGLHADGHEIPVELGLSILKTSDGEVFLSFLRDLTERNQRDAEIKEAREKAERANVAKSFVISMLAHDMRTAVGGVTASVALLDREGMPERESELVEAINSSAHQLRRLLNDTLDFARLESGEIEIAKAPVRVAEIASEITQSWAARFENEAMNFSVTVEETAPSTVSIDMARLRQVLGNLLANAMKYAPGANVAIQIAGDRKDDLKIIVSDTGKGFLPEALSTAFEPFVRPDGQSSDGAGLGLTIVKTLVEKLNGTVALSASPEGGAHIEVTFFECRTDDEPIHSDVSESHLKFDGKSALLVEDNATNQLIATRFLEQLGCDVTVCSDGESGLHTAESIGFDVIFMDIDLPKMNGKDAMRAIRSGHGPNKDTPLIGFTAFAIRSQKDEIMAAGANTILAKPISGRGDFEVVLKSVLSAEPSGEIQQDKNQTDAAIDPQRLTSLRETLGDKDFRDLAAEFVKDITSLRQALSKPKRDAELIRKTTHIAISVTGAIGAHKAQSYAESLNTRAHSSTQDGLAQGVIDLDSALGETMTALDQFLEAS